MEHPAPVFLQRRIYPNLNELGEARAGDFSVNEHEHHLVKELPSPLPCPLCEGPMKTYTGPSYYERLAWITSEGPGYVYGFQSTVSAREYQIHRCIPCHVMFSCKVPNPESQDV